LARGGLQRLRRVEVTMDAFCVQRERRQRRGRNGGAQGGKELGFSAGRRLVVLKGGGRSESP
jgi:hypothetical protein